MKFKSTIVFAVCVWASALLAQNPSIAPQVINSAGGHNQVGSTGISITDNVGEPFTQSSGINVASMMITEGFIQPETVIATGFSLSAIQQNQQCLEINDGMISLTLNSTISNYDVNYIWNTPINCATNNCAKIDSLKPGNYGVKVTLQYTTNVGIVKRDSIERTFTIESAKEPCQIKVFSGVSPNNDNNNDFFTIENISGFPDNHVMIFNRWGNLLFDVKGYDQGLDGKRWPSAEDLTKLSSSTYFYIIEIKPGANPVKGWLELIKN